MRIGLVRHFKVNIHRARFMTSMDFDEYSYNYDRSDVIPNEIVIDEEWDKCYCSSMPRAITTAKTIYHGEIVITDKLTEIPAVAGIKTKLKLPYQFWAILNRTNWGRDHVGNPEGKSKTLKRINEIMEEVLREELDDIIIVSHAGTMYEIQKILIKKGFDGERFITAKNGRLYQYKRRDY